MNASSLMAAYALLATLLHYLQSLHLDAGVRLSNCAEDYPHRYVRCVLTVVERRVAG